MNCREFMRASGAAVTAAFVGTPAFAEGKPIKIGYNVATLANPFFQGMTKGVVDASSKFPGMTLLNTNANGDANTQSTMVVDLINQGVDALILNPINANAIVPVVQQANKKGIPVFTLDRGASCGPCQVNFLETDNVALGREGRSTSSTSSRRAMGRSRATWSTSLASLERPPATIATKASWKSSIRPRRKIQG